jgi:hypothetical protein
MRAHRLGRVVCMNLKMLSGTLGIVGAVCLLLVQFLSWGGVAAEGGTVFGFDFPDSEVDAHTWTMKARAGDDTHSESWYSDEMEDDDEGDDDDPGLTQIRFGIPFLLAGLVVTALGSILALAARGGSGAIVLLVGGLLAAAGTTLFILGVSQMFDGAQEWEASYYLAIAGSAVAVLGGVVGLVGQNRQAV